MSSFVYISFCDVVVPFCVSKDVPFNIVGIDWIPVIANLPNFVVSYQRPSEVSTALTVLHGMDLITPPFPSKCMNVMCECCEPGKVVTRSIPPPEDVHISEESVGAGQPSDGVKDVPVCNVRTQFPEYSPSEEDGIVVVSPSCVQGAQVSTCDQGGRTVCNEQKYAVKDVPVCNVRTQFPEYSPSEEDGIVVVSPSCVQGAQVSKCDQGGRTVCNEQKYAVKDVPVCNVRTQFPEYSPSEEDGIVVVSPSCVQGAQVSTCDQGGRTVCNEQKYAVKDVPVCNVRTQFPEYSPSEEDGIVVVSPSCVQDAQVPTYDQGGRTKCDECDERYSFATDDKLSASQAETLLRDLISRKKSVEISSTQEPSRVDLHSPTNTIIPREQWYTVYEPFHSQLTDLKGHLRGPQTLPYLCTVNLVDPKTPPFTCPAYPMRHPEKKSVEG